jgi:hypothetical protein
MRKFLIKNGAPKNTYDKIFKIIDNHSTFFRVSAENEYKTNEGYVLEFTQIPSDAMLKIGELKHVEEI